MRPGAFEWIGFCKEHSLRYSACRICSTVVLQVGCTCLSAFLELFTDARLSHWPLCPRSAEDFYSSLMD